VVDAAPRLHARAMPDETQPEARLPNRCLVARATCDQASDSQFLYGTQLRTSAIRPPAELAARGWQVAGLAVMPSILSVWCTGVRSPATARVLAPRRGKGHDLSRIAEIATLDFPD